jgi:hypothetical protein
MQTMSEGRIEFDGENLFVICSVKKIAKRGQPGTPQAGTWISLEPGFVVRDADCGLEIEFLVELARVQ